MPIAKKGAVKKNTVAIKKVIGSSVEKAEKAITEAPVAEKIVVEKISAPAKIAKKIIKKSPANSIPVHKKGEEPPISNDAQINSIFSQKAGKVKEMAEKLEQERVESIDSKQKTSTPGISVGLYKKIAFSFIFLTIILISVVLYFMFSKLTIIITPNIEKISDSITVGVVEKDVTSGKVLGLVNQEEISEAKTYQSTGEDIIGETVVGKVTIINNYDKNQPLVASTRLLSADNKLFRIKNTSNVPAGESVEVEVYADVVSPEMAIAPTTFTIPGLWAGLQDKIYGKSNQKFEYAQEVKKFIKQADIDNAIIDMKKTLLSKAKGEFGANYKGNDQVMYELDENSITTEIDGKVSEEKDSFEINMKTKISVIAFSSKDVVGLIQDKIKAVIPAKKKLVSLDEGNIVYSLSDYNLQLGTAVIDATFSGQVTTRDDSEIILRDNIVGLSSQQLDEYLKSFKEIQNFEIIFTPKFIKKVPTLVDRINIEIKK